MDAVKGSHIPAGTQRTGRMVRRSRYRKTALQQGWTVTDTQREAMTETVSTLNERTAWPIQMKVAGQHANHFVVWQRVDTVQ